MSATLSTPTKVGEGSWRYEWTGTSPFIVHTKGDNYTETPITNTSRTLIFQSADEPDPLEVVDSADTNIPYNIQFPGRAVIQWRGIASVVGYRVEQYISSVWTHKIIVYENGRGYYEYTTDWLTDDTTHQFRVIPVYGISDEGNPLTYSIKMVRNPDPPSIEVDYTAGDIVVSAAS